ncbi:MAG: PAS domain S-box protein, partial [Desulfosalsimonadaceae bacterium]
MLSENIILGSAGSLSVAMVALLMFILQVLFFVKRPQYTWYAWATAMSFCALLYAVSVFLEYNTSAGPLNRFSGILEWTALVCLIHSVYGFTFSYLGLRAKRYHLIAGIWHAFILSFMWFTPYVVADRFVTRDLVGLTHPYIEPALGPLGPVFILYAVTASVTAMGIWIKSKAPDTKYRNVYLTGMGLWLLLGIHDALVSLGVSKLPYMLEYGFLGFAMAVLWVVFSSYLEMAAEEKYRVITECANDCILVIQEGKMVFANTACAGLIDRPLTGSTPVDFLGSVAPEDRKALLEHYNILMEGGHAPSPHPVRIVRKDGEQRFVGTSPSLPRSSTSSVPGSSAARHGTCGSPRL